MYVIDPKATKVFKTIPVESSLHPSNQRYLVVAKGQLCSFCWYLCCIRDRVAFLLYSLDEKHGPWVPMMSLTFMILFMSSDSCFCINAKCFDDKYPYVCVVYAEHCLEPSAGQSPAKHKLLEVASLDLQLGIFLIRGNDESVRSKIIRFVTDMMWPPPVWFWPDTYSASAQFFLFLPWNLTM